MSAEERPDESIVPGIADSNLPDVLARRELALAVADHIGEVLAQTIDIQGLVVAAESGENSTERLQAKRALRCIAAVSIENSEVVQAVGESGLYDYAEAVVTYGAGTEKYLELMKAYDLTSDEATGVYALRSLISAQADGEKPSFREICDGLMQAGMTLKEAAADPDYALEVLDKAGCFSNFVWNTTFDRTRFRPDLADRDRKPGRHIDNVRNDDSEEYVRNLLEGRRFDETDD